MARLLRQQRRAVTFEVGAVGWESGHAAPPYSLRLTLNSRWIFPACYRCPGMRFGTFHLIGSPDMAPAAQRFDDTLRQIELADSLGLDMAWIAEHHFSNYGYSANPLLLIARACASAPRLRFGQAVLVTPFWHPLRLAEDIAITDLLTGGRLEIGLGR